MADIVKTNLRKIKQEISVGSRVSVAKTFFDDSSLDVNQRYSYYLPASCNRLLGVVVAAFSGNRFQIKWDVDETVGIVNSSKLTLESDQSTSADSDIRSSNSLHATDQDATSSRTRTKRNQDMKLPETDVSAEQASSADSDVSFNISPISLKIHAGKGLSIGNRVVSTNTRKNKIQFQSEG